MTIDERMPLTGIPLRSSASSGLEELIEVTAALRRQLAVHESLCRRVLADVDGQVPVGRALTEVRADSWRSTVTTAIQEFEVTRHRARLALVAMSLQDGMSIAEIARAWGVSRQLASRWVQECRLLHPSCDGFGQDVPAL